MKDTKLFLRVTLKILTGFGVLSLAYILLAGLFINPNDDTKESYTFELSALSENQAVYFKVNRRELLVIKVADNYRAFWANDPIYGCRLELKNDFIKPVCIDIEYDLMGYSKAKDQLLAAPDYKINQYGELVVY